jgi:glycosyltransferase involved in cell wall biosynthesis
MKRIVHIITGLDTGGAEMWLYRLISRLSPAYQSHVISLTDIGDVGKLIKELGISVEAVGMRRGAPNPFAIFRLARTLKKIKPDIVHTWMYHSDLLGGLAARLAGVPALCWTIRHTNLSTDVNKLSTLVVARACSLLSRWAPNKILCCSEVARKAHINYGYLAQKIVVLPNGFDLSRFSPNPASRTEVRKELGLHPGTPLVGLIGRFNSQKNHMGFVQAAGLLHRKMPTTHFLLAGKGVDACNKELFLAIEQAGLTKVIHLLGLRNDMPRLMSSLDLMASSSIGEAFPNVLGEAMACGVPCAVTDVGDSEYIVGDTGLIVPPGDMTRLSEAMESLLNLSPAERCALGARARKRVAEHFELDSVIRQYEAFYDTLSDQRRNQDNTAGGS